MACADKGAEIVRITVQGMSEAKACAEIKEKLMKKGYTTPLVADIHFAPKVALAVADCLDKIRINPGNFADGRKKFETINYEDEKEYQAELDYIEEVRSMLWRETPLAQSARTGPEARPDVCQCARRGVGAAAGTHAPFCCPRCLHPWWRSARSWAAPCASAPTTAPFPLGAGCG